MTEEIDPHLIEVLNENGDIVLRVENGDNTDVTNAKEMAAKLGYEVDVYKTDQEGNITSRIDTSTSE